MPTLMGAVGFAAPAGAADATTGAPPDVDVLLVPPTPAPLVVVPAPGAAMPGAAPFPAAAPWPPSDDAAAPVGAASPLVAPAVLPVPTPSTVVPQPVVSAATAAMASAVLRIGTDAVGEQGHELFDRFGERHTDGAQRCRLLQTGQAGVEHLRSHSRMNRRGELAGLDAFGEHVHDGVHAEAEVRRYKRMSRLVRRNILGEVHGHAMELGQSLGEVRPQPV